MMKYIDEYRNARIIKKLVDKIHGISDREIILMEVCGTHTMVLFRSGLRKLLPKNIRLLSGPGCPVCVTSNHYLDKAICYCRRHDIIIATFGDMVKVPGSISSLEKAKAQRRNIFVVYSPLDALKIARDNPDKKVIFLGIGFETTAPLVAATIKIAKEKEIKNFFVFSGHKLIPPAMEALLSSGQPHLDGFICPGHVSTIIGTRAYEFIPEKYNIPCVITGFEPLDIAEGIYLLVKQITQEKLGVEVQYKRSVKEEGNRKALDLMREVFTVGDSIWRGIGNIPQSGLKIGDYFIQFDAEVNIKVDLPEIKENKGCICGRILQGLNSPLDCRLFKKECRPQNPLGACMVSSEGVCAAYYKYKDEQ